MPTHLLAYLAVAVVVVAVPGPSVAFVMSRALVAGRRHALVSVLGNEVGLLAQTVALAVGIGQVVAASATAFVVVKIVGAAYLVYLGVQAIRHRAEGWTEITGGAPTAVGSRRLSRSFVDGLLVGTLNPKTLVFFAAFLPQFFDTTAGATGQFLVLGGLFALIALVLDSVWVLGAGTARAWFVRSPRRLAALGATGGVTMIGLGVAAAASERAAT